MSIQAGEKMPEGSFGVMTADGPGALSTEELFAGKKVVLVSVPGAAPQSATQVQEVSPIPGSQTPSPQVAVPQSIEQLAAVSPPSQMRSPQQASPPPAEVQVLPLPVQRASPHPTGFWPSPSPQQ